jgi:nicotinamide riboside transporter PnuC
MDKLKAAAKNSTSGDLTTRATALKWLNWISSLGAVACLVVIAILYGAGGANAGLTACYMVMNIVFHFLNTEKQLSVLKYRILVHIVSIVLALYAVYNAIQFILNIFNSSFSLMLVLSPISIVLQLAMCLTFFFLLETLGKIHNVALRGEWTKPK